MTSSTIIEFIETFCRQTIGEWHMRRMQLLDWQKNDLLIPLYDMKRADGVTRQFSEAVVFAPKNSGKTTFCAALSLAELMLSGPGANIVIVANTIAQANLCFSTAANMVDFSPELSKRLWVRRNIKTIEYEANKSMIQVFSGDGKKGKSGHPISLLIFDELAELEAKHRDYYETLLFNTRKRPNSLMLSITTAGKPDTIGAEMFTKCNRILAKEITDPHFLPVVYSAPLAEDWTDLETARRCAAPGTWGVTVYPEKVREELASAIGDHKKEWGYRTWRLCQYGIGSGEQWLSPMEFEACKEDFKEESFHGQMAWFGIDLGRTKSDTSYCVVVKKDKIYYVMPRYIVPQDLLLQRQESSGQPYRAYSQQGLVKTTPGNYVDFTYVKDFITQEAKNFRVEECAFDPYQADELWQLLEREGLVMVEQKQRPMDLAPATIFMERLVKEKRLRWCHPLLAWNVHNAVTREDAAGNPTITKKGYSGLIDGLSATLNALSRAMLHDADMSYFA